MAEDPTRMTERLDYPGYLAKLEGLVREKETGTLFAKTDDNHLVVAVVRDGAIVSLAHGPKRGADAIGLVKQMGHAEVRVDPNAIAYGNKPLPPTDEILASLRSAVAVSASAGVGGLNTAEVRSVLCELLTDYLGPAAPIICDEKMAALGPTVSPAAVDLAVRELAEEIDDEQEAGQFQQLARQRLKPGG